MMRMSVIDGAPVQSFEFPEDVVSIGRSKRNVLALDDKTLSRTHCEIAAVGGRFLLVNHARTNGTCVNGRPVGEAFLKAGDTVLVGRVALRFEGGDAGPVAESRGKAGKRRILGALTGGKSDPLVYGIAYAAGLALSPVLYLIFR